MTGRKTEVSLISFCPALLSVQQQPSVRGMALSLSLAWGRQGKRGRNSPPQSPNAEEPEAMDRECLPQSRAAQSAKGRQGEEPEGGKAGKGRRRQKKGAEGRGGKGTRRGGRKGAASVLGPWKTLPGEEMLKGAAGPRAKELHSSLSQSQADQLRDPLGRGRLLSQQPHLPCRSWPRSLQWAGEAPWRPQVHLKRSEPGMLSRPQGVNCPPLWRHVTGCCRRGGAWGPPERG